MYNLIKRKCRFSDSFPAVWNLEMNIIVLQGWAKPAICIAPPSFRAVNVQWLFGKQIFGRRPVVPLTGRSSRNLLRLRFLTKVSWETKLGGEKNNNKFRSPDRLQMNPKTLKQLSGYCCPWGRYHHCAAESLPGVKGQHGSTYCVSVKEWSAPDQISVCHWLSNRHWSSKHWSFYCFYSNSYFLVQQSKPFKTITTNKASDIKSYFKYLYFAPHQYFQWAIGWVRKHSKLNTIQKSAYKWPA